MVTAVVMRAARAPSGEAAKSGPWGLAIILLLCLACYFLFKSMSKHMRKVREQFPTERPNRPGAPGAARPSPAGTPAETARDPAPDRAGDAADGAPPASG